MYILTACYAENVCAVTIYVTGWKWIKSYLIFNIFLSEFIKNLSLEYKSEQR